jgi:predicted ATPase
VQLLTSITLKNLLSFSKNTKPLKLESLNILIGINGSGKSNLIEAIALLRSFSNGKSNNMISKGDGIDFLFHKSTNDSIKISLEIPNPKFDIPIEHSFEFQKDGSFIKFNKEEIKNIRPVKGKVEPYIFYSFSGNNPMINVGKPTERKLTRDSIDLSLSILSQRRDPENYPEISLLAELYERIRIFNNWEFGKNSLLRSWQQTGTRNKVLEEDYSNFFMFLNRLFVKARVKKQIIDELKVLNSEITDIHIEIDSSKVYLSVTEGDYNVPASRISDGTLRYLVLLGILLDPDPPPLICLEEPELGLHPDLISNIAKLLKDAAYRTQLIVTTHSELLVNAFTDEPETIVVCEKFDGETTLKRLEPERLKIWLEYYKYSLGDVWLRGELGGVR